MTIEPTPELVEAVEGINHWLEFAKQNNPDKPDFLKAVGYPGKAPVKQEWLETILAALPEEVTNPKPELPSEPGWYLDKDNFVWTLDEAGWSLNAHEYAPYTRLMPEKPPVTEEQLVAAWDKAPYSTRIWDFVLDYINNR